MHLSVQMSVAASGKCVSPAANARSALSDHAVADDRADLEMTKAVVPTSLEIEPNELRLKDEQTGKRGQPMVRGRQARGSSGICDERQICYTSPKPPLLLCGWF